MRRIIRRAAALLALALLTGAAWPRPTGALARADVLALPASLTKIEERAFYGNAALKTVIVPEGVTQIGSQAFAYSGLTRITLPESLPAEGIADDMLAGLVPAQVAVYAVWDSPAYIWAKSKGFDVRAPEDDYTFEIAGGQCTITGYLRNDAAELTLPGTLAQYPVTAIGAGAFAGHDELTELTVPAGVTAIGAGAFEGCAEDLLLICAPGSTAMTYAKNNKRDYRAGTTCRALLIGQTYSGYNTLDGPANDVDYMARVLSMYAGTQYAGHIITKKNRTRSGMLNAISDAFSGAKAQDVSLFYYSGHGVSSSSADYRGALVGTDGYLVTPAELRAALDKIPGRKVVIIDACFSGNMIGKGAQAKGAADGDGSTEAFVADFIQAFSAAPSGAKAAGLNAGDYYVITACSGREESYEAAQYVGGTFPVMGCFTYALARGCGWDFETDAASGAPEADANENGVVTLQEAYAYARDYAYNDTGGDQTAQVYPSNCNWFGLLRSR